MKKSSIIAVLLGFLLTNAFPQDKYPFHDPALGMEKRIDNIMSMLTMEEKFGFITSQAVPGLNIPSPGRAEGIHQTVLRGRGTATGIPTTSFCQVYGMGSTWDPDLIRQAGKVVGYEARYATQSEDYNRSCLVLWGPTSDLARDPRWGRNDESFSEDPFLTGTMVVSYIQGMQGNDPNYWQAAALLKHVFANSNETTRGRSSSDFDDRLMREYYSVPFRMGFTEGGAKSYMAAYNAWNGVPMHVNPVLKDVVADEWGADWIVSSDAGAIETIVTGHKYLDSLYMVFGESLKLGMNQYLSFGSNVKEMLLKAMENDIITEADLDNAVRNKLKTTLKLGLLDPQDQVPYAGIGRNGEPEPWNTEAHKSVARQVARESVVLLKNEDGMLPLSRSDISSIAVVGPMADTVIADFYSGILPYGITVLDGMRNKLGNAVKINYALDNEYNAAVEAAKASDAVIIVVGNDPGCGAAGMGEVAEPDLSSGPCTDCSDGREGRDRIYIDLAAEDLIKEVCHVNKNVIVVLVSSFPYAINWSDAHVPAIMHITHAAQEQGTAIADVVFGDYNPAGRLVQTWPRSLAQLPRMMEYDITKGSTYMYFKDEPLYPFGYGLSYTTFEYANMKLSAERLAKDVTLTVSVDIKNTGTFEGDEVVQLYVSFPDSKVVRPLKALKGFHRLGLKPGETKTVQLELTAESLAWWNEDTDSWELEQGTIHVMIGSSSSDIKLQKSFIVN